MLGRAGARRFLAHSLVWATALWPARAGLVYGKVGHNDVTGKCAGSTRLQCQNDVFWPVGIDDNWFPSCDPRSGGFKWDNLKEIPGDKRYKFASQVACFTGAFLILKLWITVMFANALPIRPAKDWAIPDHDPLAHDYALWDPPKEHDRQRVDIQDVLRRTKAFEAGHPLFNGNVIRFRVGEQVKVDVDFQDPRVRGTIVTERGERVTVDFQDSWVRGTIVKINHHDEYFEIRSDGVAGTPGSITLSPRRRGSSDDEPIREASIPEGTRFHVPFAGLVAGDMKMKRAEERIEKCFGCEAGMKIRWRLCGRIQREELQESILDHCASSLAESDTDVEEEWKEGTFVKDVDGVQAEVKEDGPQRQPEKMTAVRTGGSFRGFVRDSGKFDRRRYQVEEREDRLGVLLENTQYGACVDPSADRDDRISIIQVMPQLWTFDLPKAKLWFEARMQSRAKVMSFVMPWTVRQSIAIFIIIIAGSVADFIWGLADRVLRSSPMYEGNEGFKLTFRAEMILPFLYKIVRLVVMQYKVSRMTGDWLTTKLWKPGPGGKFWPRAPVYMLGVTLLASWPYLPALLLTILPSGILYAALRRCGWRLRNCHFFMFVMVTLAWVYVIDQFTRQYWKVDAYLCPYSQLLLLPSLPTRQQNLDEEEFFRWLLSSPLGFIVSTLVCGCLGAVAFVASSSCPVLGRTWRTEGVMELWLWLSHVDASDGCMLLNHEENIKALRDHCKAERDAERSRRHGSSVQGSPPSEDSGSCPRACCGRCIATLVESVRQWWDWFKEFCWASPLVEPLIGGSHVP